MKLIRMDVKRPTTHTYTVGEMGRAISLVWLASLVWIGPFLVRFTLYLSFFENRLKKYHIAPKRQPSKVESFCMGGPYVRPWWVCYADKITFNNDGITV